MLEIKKHKQCVGDERKKLKCPQDFTKSWTEKIIYFFANVGICSIVGKGTNENLSFSYEDYCWKTKIGQITLEQWQVQKVCQQDVLKTSF